MKRYCEECKKEVETTIVTKKESYNVCGEMIDVNAQVLVCAECGEELFSEELDNATLINAYNEYRRRHKLLLPEEIKEIRQQYGLSQRGFSKLLNGGDKTICRYENGSLQDRAHNSLLIFLKNPENMRSYLTENEIDIDEKQKTKLLDIVERLEQNLEYRENRKFFDEFFSETPCEENGFKGFDYESILDTLRKSILTINRDNIDRMKENVCMINHAFDWHSKINEMKKYIDSIR